VRVLDRLADEPLDLDEKAPEKAKWLAAWVFILPVFFGYARPPNAEKVYLGTGYVGLILLALIVLQLMVSGTHKKSSSSVILAAFTCISIIILYSTFWPWMKGNAPADPSDGLAIAAAAYCVLAFAYARLAYSERIFIEVFWRTGIVAVAIAYAAYALRGVTGGWLVHQQYGTPRLEGFLSEPSQWAFILPGLFLLSLERKKYLVTVMITGAVLLAKSPITMIATAISITLWLVLSNRHRRARKEILLLLGFIWAGAFVWLKTIQVSGVTVGSSYFDLVVVRLASGIVGVETNGATGINDRYSSTKATFDQLSEHGWLYTGIGPGFESYLFKATGGMLPNALPVYLLGCFGVLGVIVFVAVLVATLGRMRGSAAFAIFMPFMVASSINSAAGWESYKFFIVAAVIFAGPAWWMFRTVGARGSS
jgi:hypothetical protein